MEHAKIRAGTGDQRPLDGVLGSTQFLNTLPAAVLLQDDQGMVLDCNNVAEAILGDSRDELIARLPDDPIWDSVREDGSPFPFSDQPTGMTLINGEPHFDVIIGTSNFQRARRWVSVNTCRVVLLNGAFGVISSFIDVTARIKKERLLDLSSEVNRVIMFAKDEITCLQELCEVIVRKGSYAMSWIRIESETGYLDLDANFKAGSTEYLNDDLASWFNSKESESGPVRTALRTGIVQRTQEIAKLSPLTPWQTRATTYGFRSSIAIPFLIGQKSAVLSIFDRDAFAFDNATVEGLENITKAIEFGVAHIRSLEETEGALGNATSALRALRTAEQSLSESDRWFRKLVASSSDMIVVIDSQGVLCYANRANAITLGYESNTQIGLNLFDMIHPDDLDVARAHFDEAKHHDGPTTPTVLRILTKSGEWRFIESVLTNFLHDPAIQGIVGNGRDVTDRTLLTNALETLTRGNQVLVHAQEESSLLAATCQVIVDTGGFDLAWVGYAESGDAKIVQPIAAAGLTDYLKEITISWGDNLYGHGPTGTAIRTQTTQVVDDIAQDIELEPWRIPAAKYNLRSGCVFPLTVDDKTIGALSIYSHRPSVFGRDQVTLLSELADELSYGIGRLRDSERLAQNESRIHEADQRFRLAFEKNMAPMLFVDLQDRVIAANDAACQMLGYSMEELLGKDSVPFTYNEDIGVTEESRTKMVDDNAGQTHYVKRYIRKDGRVIVAEVSRSPALDAAGNTLYFVISQRDITDVVHRDLVLALLWHVNKLAMTTSSEVDFYQQLCNILVDEGGYVLAWIGVDAENDTNGINVVCAAGAVDYLDEETAPWWGTKESAAGPSGIAIHSGESVVVSDLSDNAVNERWRERALQFGFGSLVAIPDHYGGRRAVLSVYHRQNLAFDEVTVKGLESIVREAEFSVAHVRSTKNTETALSEVTVALDALTETEHALSESEQRFRLAFEHNSAPMVFSDLDELVVAVNDAFSQLVGYSKEELQGKSSKLFTHPDDIGITETMLSRLNSGEVDDVRYTKRYLTKDRRVLIMEVSMSPARDLSGRTLYYVSSERDITEEHDLSAQLAISQRLEAIGTLAGGVAHDFNNLLMVIRGYTSLLLRNLKDDEMIDAAKRIDMTVDEAASFIRQLLAYSRQQSILPQATDINEIVRGSINLMERLLGDNVTVDLELEKTLPLAWVDPTQIQQVLLNLISNARDALSSGGTITFRTESVVIGEQEASHFHGVDAGSYVLLEVDDNGVGMNETTLGRIFEPYFTTKSLGTGLGLATVYGITKQSRGHVDVTSTLGIGTSFKLYFPLAHFNTLNGTDDVTWRLPLDKHVATLSGTETILVAEDIDETRELLTNSLRELGYRVLDARGGIEALELSRSYEGSIAVLVSDIVMPDLNGYELAHQLIQERPTTQVILTSGYAKDILSKSELANANFTKVQKPYHLDDIAYLIRQLLDSQ